MLRIESHSPAQTQNIAKLFAGELLKIKGNKSAIVVTFKGDLGAGKTTFIQAIGKYFGINKMTSPTFTLVKSYKLHPVKSDKVGAKQFNRVNAKSYKLVYHLDCYRLHGAKDIKQLGFDELIKDPKNLIFIEWPEKISKAVPKEKIQIQILHGKSENERIIKFQ